MVLIPAGEFVMGRDDPGADHGPAHRVRLRAFFLDRHEVTNAEYLRYSQATGKPLPEYWGMERFRSGPDFPAHPVIGVSWREARDFARWAGKRLPTEAEWEYAARGGRVGLPYPFGTTIDPSQANYAAKGPSPGPVAVGQFPPNGYGLFDMAGNVVEWVADYYAPDTYAQSPLQQPSGPKRGKLRVIRGGGWHSGPFCTRLDFRNALPANWRDINVGFRCAKDAP
jgi:iron(II)-dependent oxidoreductase